jgi:hypothetical protein
VRLEWLDRQALKDKAARLVRSVFKDHLEISDRKGLQGRGDSLEHEVSQVHLDSLDRLGQTETLDRQAQLDLRAIRGKLGRPEARVMLACRVQ